MNIENSADFFCNALALPVITSYKSLQENDVIRNRSLSCHIEQESKIFLFYLKELIKRKTILMERWLLRIVSLKCRIAMEIDKVRVTNGAMITFYNHASFVYIRHASR